MDSWALAAAVVGVAFAVAYGVSQYKDPSIECVRIGGQWTLADTSGRDHCQKVKP